MFKAKWESLVATFRVSRHNLTGFTASAFASTITVSTLLGCGLSKPIFVELTPISHSLVVTPGQVTVMQGGSQQFKATATDPVWSLGSLSGIGSVDATGFYTAPSNVSMPLAVVIVATSLADPSATSSATITVLPCTPDLDFETSVVNAGATHAFNKAGCGATAEWTVDGIAGGNKILGTISMAGLYTAPRIDPGEPVIIAVAGQPKATLEVSVSIANPALSTYTGATYATTLRSWRVSMLPWIQSLSGLEWDPVKSTWSAVPNWTPGPAGIAPNVYYLEEALRPATRMAIMKQDVPLLEQLATFHTALLQQRTTTIGSMLASAPTNSILFIDGAPSVRTFAWYEGGAQVRIRDCQTCNAQYLSTAARLLRAIAEMPAERRTEPMLTFVHEYSGFLVSDQLLRLMYGSTAWSHWNNPEIPQPAVSAWAYLATSGYKPPHPIRYQAAMTDIELWLLSSSAEVLAADYAAPEFEILDSDTRVRLQQAVTAGTALVQARCSHAVAPDGADVLSTFAGDYDDHPDYDYAGNVGASQPTTSMPLAGVGWDTSHAYRLPIIFRSLYETRAATGQTFPARKDLVALANSYVHLASDGNAQLPGFSNFIDGWDGWFQVAAPGVAGGYPPSHYCNSTGDPNTCLTAGTLQGWGELAFVNPDLAALSQHLIDFAYDDSSASAAFKQQHYFYAAHPYQATATLYPQLMVYVAGDAAERLQ